MVMHVLGLSCHFSHKRKRLGKILERKFTDQRIIRTSPARHRLSSFITAHNNTIQQPALNRAPAGHEVPDKNNNRDHEQQMN